MSAADISRALCDAYVATDRAAAERLVAADFRFTSPLDNRIDRATYFARCWPNSATTAGFDFIHLVEADGRVFLTYEGKSTSGRRFRNTEVHTVHGDQVIEVEVYFGWDVPHEAPPGGFVDEG